MTTQRFTTIVVAAVAGLAAIAPASALAGGDVVKVRDACDPASFNAAIGDGTCVRDGDSHSRVTFDEFLGGFPSGHGAWSFSSPVSIDRGESVSVRFDRGGEFHTFSEVAHYGPGCVDLLNDAMGLEGPPVIDCEAAFSDPSQFVSPDFSRTRVAPTSAGKHRFMCAIHPWMRTSITVR